MGIQYPTLLHLTAHSLHARKEKTQAYYQTQLILRLTYLLYKKLTTLLIFFLLKRLFLKKDIKVQVQHRLNLSLFIDCFRL